MRRLFALLLLLTLALSISAQVKVGGGGKVSGTAKMAVSAASFPATGILDDFNRANEGPPPSASWTTGIDGGTDGLSVTSNEARAASASLHSAYRHGTDYGPNLEIYATLGSTIGPSRLSFCASDCGTANWDGYTVLAYTPTNEFYVYVVTNGGQSQLGLSISQTLASGDSFGFRRNAGTGAIDVYFCASGTGCGISGAGWTYKDTRTDSTYTGVGKIGMATFDVIGITLDNFGGGTP